VQQATRLWPKRAAAITGLLALIVFTVQSCRKALREQGCDLTCYLDGGDLALAGETPYDAEAYFEFLYPPFFALEMTPLSILPIALASVIWSLLTAFSLVYLFRTVRNLVANGRKRAFDTRDLVVLVAVAAIGFRLIHANFANGQVNLIMVGMLTAFLVALRNGRDRSAGFWLALAVQTKTVPILLLGLLVVRGRWRAIGWTAVFGIAMTLLPLLAWGTDTIAIYQDWFAMIDHKLKTYTIDMGAFTIDNAGNREYFTLRGMLATLWPATSPNAIAKYGCIATVLGTTLWFDRSLHARKAPHATLAAFSLWLIAALLIAPMSEKHHLGMMLPAVALGLYAVIDGTRRQRIESLVWAGGAATAIALSKPFPYGPFYFLAVVTVYAWAVRTAYLPNSSMARRDSSP
jgi:alpha-1,2-mannosyltransferase